MKGKILNMTVLGYHKYMDLNASMDIRLFGIASVIKHTGELMRKAETVTFFNEMCLFAPASLIDKNIVW